MSHITPKPIAIELEDRARLQSLSEEARGRLEEMAAISTRVLGIPLTKEANRKFVLNGEWRLLLFVRLAIELLIGWARKRLIEPGFSYSRRAP